MKYVVSIIIAALGFLITWKATWIMENFGRWQWFDENLGVEGGSRLAYKLIGILAIIGAFMYMTDLLGPLVMWIFSSGGGPR